MQQRISNPFQYVPLTYGEVLNMLTQYTGINAQQGINRMQMYDILNQMSLHNTNSEFNNTVAQELFDRIEGNEQVFYFILIILNLKKLKRPLNLANLAETFVEGCTALDMKYNFMVDQEQIFGDQLQSLEILEKAVSSPSFSNKLPQQGTNFIMLDEIKCQMHESYAQPYLVIRLGQFVNETDVSQPGQNDWYRWKIRLQIPVDTFMDDLVIQIFDRQRNSLATLTEYGNVLFNVESLPFDDMKQATFQVFKDNIETDISLEVSCQLILGNITSAKYQINHKLTVINQKLNQIVEEMDIYNQQMRELYKPFKKGGLQKVSYTPSINRWSEQQDNHHETINNEIVQKQNFLHQISDKISHNEIFSQQQKSLGGQVRISTAAWKSQKITPKVEAHHERDFTQYLYRLDVYSLLNLLLSMIVNYGIPEFNSACICLFVFTWIMLRKYKDPRYFIIITSFILFSVIADMMVAANVLEIMDKIVFGLLIFNVIIKIMTLVSCILLYKEQHLSILRMHFLSIN